MRHTNLVVALAVVMTIAAAAAADSLFTEAAARQGTLISDKRIPFEVGDIVTVLVRETIDGSIQADTNTKKEADVEAEAAAADNLFLLANKPEGYDITTAQGLPNWKIEAENEHKGKGDTSRKNSLVMTISCTVIEIFPNGNIAIEGQKRVTINREDSKLFVSGIVRARDVSPANTVQSNQVANAVIELKGLGPLWNNQRRGLITRFLDWFSPF